MGDRVVHRAGDALIDDLGSDSYDLVFLAALVHHFDEETNRELMRRIARHCDLEGSSLSGNHSVRMPPTTSARSAVSWTSSSASSAGPGRGVPMRSPTGSGGRARAPAANPHVDGARPVAASGSEAGVNRSAAAEDVLDLRCLSQHAAGNSGNSTRDVRKVGSDHSIGTAILCVGRPSAGRPAQFTLRRDESCAPVRMAAAAELRIRVASTWPGIARRTAAASAAASLPEGMGSAISTRPRSR